MIRLIIIPISLLSACNSKQAERSIDSRLKNVPVRVPDKFSMEISDNQRKILEKSAYEGDLDAARRLQEYFVSIDDEIASIYWTVWLADRGDSGSLSVRTSYLYSASKDKALPRNVRLSILESAKFYSMKQFKYSVYNSEREKQELREVISEIDSQINLLTQK